MTRPDYAAAAAEEVVTFAPGSDTAMLNGVEIPLPAPAVVVEGKLYTPLITVADASGASLAPNAAEQSVAIGRGGRELKLWLNRCEALFDGRPVDLKSPLIVHKGNVMMPADAAVAYLGASLSIDSRTGTVTLSFTPVS